MPTTPSFTVVAIMRNESDSLPRMMKSLAPFMDRGIEVCITDTGSTDNSAELARSLGARVFEAGERFHLSVDADLADRINAQFIVGDEPLVMRPGSSIFNFAAARNFSTAQASTDWVVTMDIDECFTAFDFDAVEAAMAIPEVSHLEYEFCFAHAPDGSPAILFRQCKSFDRRRIQWNPDCIVHEVIASIPGAPAGRPHYLPRDVWFLEHWQEPGRQHRSQYAEALLHCCYHHPENDRNSHYCARELMYHGRPRSALKEFDRHIAMNGWPAERAQSMVFQGDCWSHLGDDERARACYSRAFNSDPTRRVALLRLAGSCRKLNQYQGTAAYAAAALQIPYTPFYATDMREYRSLPHAHLYWAKGWTGDIPGAQHHILEALKYEPFNPEFNRDTQYYFDYNPNLAPEGWMVAPELIWLHDHAKGAQRVLEVGSWKGRSTHALATGAGKAAGVVWAVDHFRGSVGEDEQHAEAKQDDDPVYKQFLANTSAFQNLFVRRADSLEAARSFPLGYFDMLFLDGSHDRDSVLADLRAWTPRCRRLLCGHDWGTWPGVTQAVREFFNGEPDGVECSIWWKQVRPPQPHPLLTYLTAMVREGKPVSFAKLGDGEQLCMSGAQGANCDGHPYSPELKWKLRMAFGQLERMAQDRREGRTRVNVVPFSDQPAYNCILHRVDQPFDPVKAFWGAVRDSRARKVFVGPAKLHPAARMLRAEHVVIPEVNCFAEYAQIGACLQAMLQPGMIFIWCASMPGKAWMAELLAFQPDISCIDAGSAFDPLVVGQTRTEQLPQDLLLHEYREWLEE